MPEYFPWTEYKMSSVLRHVAQIPSRVKYFLVTDEEVATGDVPETGAFSMDAGNYAVVGSMISIAAFNALGSSSRIDVDPSPGAFDDGALLKDMGRQITIFDGTVAGQPHIAVYREVQRVNGTATAPAWNSTLFVKVWAADGTNVGVIRTG